MIKAEVVADSKNEFGNRITTMVVTMPRIILAEFNTHRMFSRNSASSRAIPFEKMVKSVEASPFIPLAWQKDHKGMQGVEYITDSVDISLNMNAWLEARDNAISSATYLNHGVKEGRDNGVTKQLCNRLLEPFMYHTVIVTATEWENFFALRCPQYNYNQESYGDEPEVNEYFRSKKDMIAKYGNTCVKDLFQTRPRREVKDFENIHWFDCNTGQAEIHMMTLAEAMWDAYNESVPKQLKAGEWHIPFENKIDKALIFHTEKEGDLTFHTKPLAGFPHSQEVVDKWYVEQMVKISTVMAARTSYTVVGSDQKPMTYARMCELHDEMKNQKPIHASPFEHCAQAMSKTEFYSCLHAISTEIDKRDTDKGVTSWLSPVNNFESPNIRVEGGWCGNFRGFIQYRKTLPNENITI